MRGFAAVYLVLGVVGALVVGALGVQSWRLQQAQKALGAHQQREAQLVADVQAQAATLAEERAERARVDALLAERERERAIARREWAEAEQRYQDAVRRDPSVQEWAATRMPAPVVDFLRRPDTGGDAGGTGAGAAAGVPDPVDAGPGAARRP